MTKTGSKAIPQLDQCLDRLDSLSLNDREGWRTLAQDLAALEGGIPGQMKSLLTLLGHCRSGVEAIAEKSLSDYLGIIDAIAQGFEAAKHYLENGPDRKGLIGKAVATLEKTLEGPACQAAVESEAPGDVAPADCGALTIDDAAALLVQADRQAPAEWEALATALERLSREQGYPETVRSGLREASALVRQTLQEGMPIPDEAADRLGGLLQAAMDAHRPKPLC